MHAEKRDTGGRRKNKTCTYEKSVLSFYKYDVLIHCYSVNI